MAKIDCYYIGKGWRSKTINTPTFKAYKHKDKEKNETILYPIIDELGKEVFIRGVGWKKVSKSKVVEVPVFDGEEDHWNEYVEKYGIYCLYYSLDGDGYDFYDCAKLPQATEISSIIYTGAKGYAEFMQLYHRMNDLQRKVIEEKYLADIGYGKCLVTEVKDYIFAPKYYEVYTFIPTKYQPDILEDDSKLASLWKDYRSGYIKRNSPKYQEYLALEEKKKIAFEKKINARNDYDAFAKLEAEYIRLDGLTHKAFMEVEKEINDTINKELYTDNDVFPTSTKDRIRFIYGAEVSDIYNELVEKYLS